MRRAVVARRVLATCALIAVVPSGLAQQTEGESLEEVVVVGLREQFGSGTRSRRVHAGRTGYRSSSGRRGDHSGADQDSGYQGFHWRCAWRQLFI